MLTLSPCIAKIYDSIFAERFYKWLEKIEFDKDQFAYRKNHSCQMAMFKFIQHIQENFNKSKATMAIFIDLEGAFDAIWHQGLIYQLHNDGVNGNILKLVNNILSSRTALCKVNSINEEITCSDTGACQGNNSAALFFVYYIRKMMEDITCSKIKFSDDGTLYKSANIEDIPQLSMQMKEDLYKVMTWCNKWHMPINLEKTKCMLFSKDPENIKVNISLSIPKSDGTLQTISIEQVSSQKTLGVMLDEKLSFKEHINYTKNISTSNLNKIKDLYEKHFGLPTHLALELYNSYVRTIIESSYMCWATIPEQDLDKIESIQGQALNSIMKISGKVSYNALDVEAGILPIKIRLKQILAQFGIKILRKAESNPIKQIMVKNLNRENIGKSATIADKIRMAMTNLTKNKINPLNIEPETAVHLVQISKIERNLFIWKGFGNASTRTEAQREKMRATVENFLNTINTTDITCFTDGSVINPDKHGLGKCGAGVAIYTKSLKNEPLILSKHVSNSSSSYHGELYAIKIALQKCLTINLVKVKIIHILSDCQSAILSSTNNKIADGHQEEINEICKIAEILHNRGIKVSISWIGGHNGIEGNNLADHAAKKGAALASTNKIDKITLKTAKKAILESAMEHWQKKWNYSETGSHLKAIQPTVSLGNSSKCLKSRPAQIALHHAKIGRSNLNNQDRINKKEFQEKLCLHCNVPEDTEHYFLQCQRYESQRRTMFLAIESTLNEKNIPRKMLRNNLNFLSENKDLSKSTREQILYAIELFLRETKRLL